MRRARPAFWQGIRRLLLIGPAVRRLIVSLLILLLVTLMGVAGYATIADFSLFDALYQTVTTITTIGFAEVHPLDTAGRAFTIVLAVFGVGSALYLLTAVASLVLEGDVRRDVEAWRMTNQIAALRDHYIVCGAGRVGSEVGRELVTRREPFVMLESDPAAAEACAAAGWLVIRGDASRNEDLERAGVARARGLIAATASDAGNTFITLTARAMNPRIYIVARSNEPESEPKLRHAGADRVITPPVLAGRRMAISVLHPSVVDFAETVMRGVETGEVLAQLEVEPGSAWDGARVGEALALHAGVRGLGVRHADGRLDVPMRPEAMLRAGDAVLVFARTTALERLTEAMGG